MTSIAALARRLERMAARMNAVMVNVILVRTGETVADAIARHDRVGPCIIVPERATDEELPELEIQWAEQQRRLIADAKAERREDSNELGTEHRTREHRSRRIVNSGDAAGKPNEGVARRPLAVRTHH